MGYNKVVVPEDDDVVGNSRKKSVVVDDNGYSIGTELSEEKPVQEEEPVAPIGGKNKSNKGNQKRLKTNEDEKDGKDGDDNAEIQSTGKKKSKREVKKGGNSFGASAFVLLCHEDDVDDRS